MDRKTTSEFFPHSLGGQMNRFSIAWVLFLAVTIEALISIPLLNWELAGGASRIPPVAIALPFAALLFLIIWKWRALWSRLLSNLSASLQTITTRRWVILCFILGALLRILWAWGYPSPQHSDQATYIQLARALAENHRYEVSGGGIAYWPPGYPFFLAAWFSLLGVHAWIPLLTNILLYGGTLIVIERLATRIAGPAAGKIATALLVAWPTLVMSAILASKEMLILFLLSLTLLLFARAQESETSARSLALVVLSGLLLGCACLTQPSVQLFPAVLVAYVFLRRQFLLRGFGYIVILGLALSAVILPWTFRNHRVLGAWVPVSTNGGVNFYGANNSLATGAYTAEREQSLESYDEVTRGKVGFRLGKEWIRDHPRQFLALVIRKEILFLGDDAQGAYETLKRGLGIGGLPYVAWKGLSNLYWLLLWTSILLALAVHWRTLYSQDALLAAVMLGVLYLFAIHSVFESGSKYHQPVSGFLAVLAALAFVGPADPRKNTGVSQL
jgi:4-amino-4-deoxy-L-arabinose transferase-like glycosyltransferase